MTQQPTIGRIVHAVIHDGNGNPITRPAIITRTWGEGSTSIQATVFPDVWNDNIKEVAVGKSSLTYDESACPLIDSWHWPPQPTSAVKCEEAPAIAVKVSKLMEMLESQRELCFAIEKLPASGEATNLSLMASTVEGAIQSILLNK